MKHKLQVSSNMIRDLVKKVKKLPLSPGVYIFKNNRGIPIYIGKAGNLRARVRTYFGKEYQTSAAREQMLDEIADIEIRQTESEIEALVLESRLIKTLQPRYNILMRDDKQYFYVGFTDEPFSKIFLTHRRETKNRKLKTKNFFVGPFVSGRSLKITLRTLRRIFPYCTCKRLNTNERACLNYNIGIDPGYCCVKNSKLKVKSAKLQLKVQNYKHTIENIKRILKGQKVRVINELEKEMKRAAEGRNFEQAAKLRNQLEGIQKILAHKKVIQDESIYQKSSLLYPLSPEGRVLRRQSRSTLNPIDRIEGYDISNIQGQFAVGSMAVFMRDENGLFIPKKSEYRKFKIKIIKGANDPAMLKEVLLRRFSHMEWKLPDLILVDGGLIQQNAVLQALKEKNIVIKVWGLAKQNEELYTSGGIIPLLSLPPYEAKVIAAVRDEAHRFAINYYRKLHQKSLRFAKDDLY